MRNNVDINVPEADAKPSPAIGLIMAVGLAAWGLAVAWAAAKGFFLAIPMPFIALFVAAGIVVPTLIYAFVTPVRLFLRHAGLFPLTILHVWRVPAALAFFAYGSAGALPPVFWIFAGVGDLIAGLYAARLFFSAGDARFYRGFHLFGFADFVVAVGTGLMFTLLEDPRMATIAVLPMALIPLFGVGVSGASHLIAFDLMRRGGMSSSR